MSASRALEPRRRRWSRWLWPLLTLGLRLLIGSWRIRVEGNTAALAPDADDGPIIYSFWHADLMPCGAAIYRQLVARGVPIAALVSRSGDGDVAARAGADFGFSTVRGSTSRGGFAALRALYAAIRRDRSSVMIVPDGPRGPARVAQPGTVQLAASTGAAIVPMAARVSPASRARSWDETVIPWPFAAITVSVGEPLFFERSTSVDAGAEVLAGALERLEGQSSK